MGRSGPAPKPKHQQQGRQNTSVVVLDGGKPKAPKMPTGLLKATQERWRTYWASDVARAAVDVDSSALRRLFMYYDEWDRAFDVYREERVVRGSRNQPVLSPMAEFMLKLEEKISALEKRMGLDPMSRAQLGIATGQAALTVAQMNRMAEEPDDADTDKATIVGEWSEAN